MTALLAIILAVAPATPVEPNSWFTSKEHSKTALQVANRGAITYTIDVAPDGKALRCTTAGGADLDERVCEIVMKSARFLPARDDQGAPAFAVYEGMASFLMPGKNTRPDRSKRVVAVDRLPDGVTSPAFARVAFVVDAAGTISQCVSTPGERRRFMQTLEALAPAACDALAKDYRPAPARNAAGEPVASIQSALVRFETQQASKTQ